ncbi:hypothetical protein Scep_005205 [Stephania cephalantha]|uniref:Uncharacterized protein n=1 Tax=Stephania cephalantha TaxID=152367 RepID=A0AAP0KTV9_9MAGN
MESGLRLAGTVIRRSTAWSRGNPRVCYAFVLVHRGEARPTKVSVCESRSRRRGDPKLSQGYMRRRRSESGGSAKRSRVAEKGDGGGNVGQCAKRREPAAAAKKGRGRSDARPMASRSRERSRAERRPRARRRDNRALRARARPASVVGVRCRGRREPTESRPTSTMTMDDDGDGGGEDCAAAAMGFIGGGEGKNDQRLIKSVADLSQICHKLRYRSATYLFMWLICRRSVTTLAGNLWWEKSATDL